MQHELYVHETLARMERDRRLRTVAHALALDEGLRQRTLLRAAARMVGSALVGIGGRLLTFGGSRDEAKPPRATTAAADLTRYTTPPTYSQN